MAQRSPSLEIIFNISLILWSFVIIILSLDLGFGSLERPGVGLVPVLSGFLILVSSLFVIFSRKKVPFRGRDSDVSRREAKVYFLMTSVFVCWIITMPFLGYVAVTFLATIAFSKIMELKGWLKPLVLASGTTLMAYLLFDYFLYLDLPRGILG